MPMGRRPVVPMMLEAPADVILETLPEFQLAVKMLPEASIAIACGQPPVVPNVDAAPPGVIFVTVSEPSLAV